MFCCLPHCFSYWKFHIFLICYITLFCEIFIVKVSCICTKSLIAVKHLSQAWFWVLENVLVLCSKTFCHCYFQVVHSLINIWHKNSFLLWCPLQFPLTFLFSCCTAGACIIQQYHQSPSEFTTLFCMDNTSSFSSYCLGAFQGLLKYPHDQSTFILVNLLQRWHMLNSMKGDNAWDCPGRTVLQCM